MTPEEPRVLQLANTDDGSITEFQVLSGLDAAARRGGRRLEDTWLLLFDKGLDALIDADLTWLDVKVFLALARRSPVTGEAWPIIPEEIVTRLGSDVRRVRRGVAALVAAGILRRPRPGWVEFNPDLIWRGSQKTRVEKRVLEDTRA